ncbi:MAG: ATP-binding cassette domain-containing protein [Dokdonella sp.]
MSTAPVALIELDHATVMRGLEVVLRDISLRIEQGQHTAILGPNGCGKSTFVKLIHREVYAVARSGATPVRLFGQARWNVFELRSRLGIVSSDLHREFVSAPEISALDTVICGFFASQRIAEPGEVNADMRERAQAALAGIGIGDLATRPMATLSSGEARRVLIARALVHSPQALLLDEPTSGLDIVARRGFLDLLGMLARRGVTLILVTHHLEEVVAEIGRVILLRDGGVHADGAPDEVLTSARLSSQYGTDLRVRNVGGRYALESASA